MVAIEPHYLEVGWQKVSTRYVPSIICIKRDGPTKNVWLKISQFLFYGGPMG